MVFCVCVLLCFFCKQKTAYEMRISDWSSDVCSSDLDDRIARRNRREYIAVGAVVAIFALYAIILPEPLLKIGSLLAIAGALVVAWQLACRTSRADPVAETADVRAFYRARLVTEEHMLARVGRWYLAPLVPGLATFLAGTAVDSGLANPIGFTSEEHTSALQSLQSLPYALF